MVLATESLLEVGGHGDHVEHGFEANRRAVSLLLRLALDTISWVLHL